MLLHALFKKKNNSMKDRFCCNRDIQMEMEKEYIQKMKNRS